MATGEHNFLFNNKPIPAVHILNAVDDAFNDDTSDGDSRGLARAALLAFAAGLANDLQPVRDRLSDIAGMDAEDQPAAIQDLRDDLPGLLTTIANGNGGSDALADSMSAAFFNGVNGQAAQTGDASTDELVKPTPFSTVSKTIQDNSLLETQSAKDIQGIGDDIDDRADWGDASTKANLLQELDDSLAAIQSQAEDAESLDDLSDGLDYTPEDKQGGLLAKLAVLGTIMLLPAIAEGFGAFTQAGETLEDYPCQQLYRAEPRAEPRPWPDIWTEAGGDLVDFDGSSGYDSDMVAPYDDQIWTDVSDFGTPYFPLRYQSGMRGKPVSRDDAIQLGVIDSDDDVELPDTGLNDTVAFSGDLNPDLRSSLMKQLGDDFTFNSGDNTITNSRVTPRNASYKAAIVKMRHGIEATRLINRLTDDNPTGQPFRKLFTRKLKNEEDGMAAPAGGTRLEAISGKPFVKRFASRK